MPNRTRGVLMIDNDASIRGTIVRKLVGDGIRADIAPTVDLTGVTAHVRALLS